jgi:hypothetical protein
MNQVRRFRYITPVLGMLLLLGFTPLSGNVTQAVDLGRQRNVGLSQMESVAATALSMWFDALTCWVQAHSPAARVPQGSYLFGVINDTGQHYSDEWARGVRATTLELHWMWYEPQEGVYDTDYIESMKRRLAELKAQGWNVQLVPGYQYTPDWVFANYPDMIYVNQYGERYDPKQVTEVSHRVINAPFNPQARTLVARYIARIFEDFDPELFDSVRVGGGVQGELRYPPAEWNGHANSYWAFDNHAQNQLDSGIPVEVVGWRPGVDPSPGTEGRGQLIVNPGFEQVHPYFVVPGWSQEDGVAAKAVSSRPHGGSQALEVTISTPHRVHQIVRVEPNTTFQFGGWLRSDGDTGRGRARVFLNQYDANWQAVAGASHGRLETASTGWTYLTGSVTTSPATQYLKVELDGDRGGKYYFDDLWLERDGETNHQDRDIAVPLAFYDWYVQALTDYQNWQISELRKHYQGQLDVLYAGKGLRAYQVTDALTNDLQGDGWSEGSSALYGGAIYELHVSGLSARQGIALYLTGIDEPAEHLVDDSSPHPGDWSGARWMAYLARSQGLPVWGENSGQDSAEKLLLSVQRMHANGFEGLMWAFESELYADASSNDYANIDEYEALITAYSRLNTLYLPQCLRSLR